MSNSANPVYFERAFRIRMYECDAYGHVNHANYLRFMQETAFDASAAVGYSIERYRQMGWQWLIRETDITYLRPLIYGDTVIVKTWVADFRRVRSCRVYEFRLADTDEPVAEARTEWIYLDAATLRPASIPPELIAAYYPGATPAKERREPFPDAPPPPPGVFRTTRRVEWRDLDQLQHVNNADYLAYIEECNSRVATAHGWPMSRLLEANLGIVARRYRIEYLEPALLGDELEISTYVSDVKRATAMRHYAVSRLRDGALLARANVLWVWVDLQSGRPKRIPDNFLRDFTPNIADQTAARL